MKENATKWINYSDEAKGEAYLSTDQRFTIFRPLEQTSYSLFDGEKKIGIFGSVKDAQVTAENLRDAENILAKEKTQ